MYTIKSIKKHPFITVFLIFFLLLFPSCSRERASMEPTSRSQLLLGTSCRITIYGQSDEDLFEAAFSRIEEIEQLMSVNIAASDISRVNQSAGSFSVSVSEDTFTVLTEAIRTATRSEGTFDPTIGPLVQSWQIGTEQAHLPSEQEIADALSRVDYSKVLTDPDTREVFLPKEGMALDLGAIAKGYAAEEVKSLLTGRGVAHAIINLGGNVLTIGNKPDGSSWRIGIQDPLSDRGEYSLIVSLSDQAVVTSGVYERFFTVGEKRYHHILDTRTGYPVENDLLSVSIIGEDSFQADALSTTVFALGLQRGSELIESIPGIEALFITSDRKVFLSSGLSDGTYPVELVDEEYSFSELRQR